ncbi:SDR family NAD(P)-dependent oxidoreductase [Mycolicibacterium vinylchloridicum]|uniref:SDR family NAD(P)-dependent oxidoreductase n=1 Tax=Mycolicibacterium vinylchloridicum TaxID=2736928 RepID=UPI0015CE54CE|nr:SDR family oxidoreductase [Mycolicibacterium vinylchloridicum]
MSIQAPDNVPPIGDWNRLLEGRVAVITGGGDGIGGAISRLFAAHGALIEIAEIDPERASLIQKEIERTGGVARSHIVDVRNDDHVERLAAAVLEKHGHIDVLVNNVGDYRPIVPFERSGPDSWEQMYQYNQRHVYAVTRAFTDSMISARRGSIVNIHSVEGMRGYPQDPVYGSMKAAIAHFTTCLAVSLGHLGIRVNGIGTDFTQTPAVDYFAGFEEHQHLWPTWAPVGRLGWPEDQARVALFLASDQSAYVTGHNIPVDGGTRAGGGWFWSLTTQSWVHRPTSLK